MPGILLALAVLFVSTSAPLVQAAAPAPAIIVAALRVTLAAGALWLYAFASGATRAVTVDRKTILRIVAAGTLLAAHFGSWITSLYLTSTAASVAIVATQPIFACIFAFLFLREGVRRKEIVGMLIAGVGCSFLAVGDFSASADAFKGDLLAMLGAATAAGYLVVGRGARKALPLSFYLAGVNTVAAVLLLSVAGLTGQSFSGYPTDSYLAIGANVVLGSLLGHTLLNYSVRVFSAHQVSLAILGEPIISPILVWIFFSEVPPEHAVAGGAIILLGIAFSFIGPKSKSKAARAL